jgi:hypothetical protein
MNSYTKDFVDIFKSDIKNGDLNGLIDSYLNKEVFNFQNTKELYDDSFHWKFKKWDPIICDIMVSNLKKYNGNEFESGRYLYSAMDGLTPRDASNIGFWTKLSHHEFYKFIHARWSIDLLIGDFEKLRSHILYHWHLDTEAQASLIDHPLAGLWWSFYMTEDEKDNSDYELTRIYFINSAFRTKYIGQSKIGRHKEALIGTLKFIRDYKLHLNNLEENARSITPFLNLLGGTKPLSLFDRDWFYFMLKKQFSSDIKQYGRLFRRDERPN